MINFFQFVTDFYTANAPAINAVAAAAGYAAFNEVVNRSKGTKAETVLQLVKLLPLKK